MARRGDIEIPIAVDTGGTEKSIQNGLIKPIENAEEALEKLGKVDAGRDLDRDLKRAQDATEDLSDELDETRRDLDKLSYAAKDVGDGGAQGMGKLRGAAQEVTQEVGSNLGEAVSSIRGDFSDLGQVGQDTLGGLAATVAGMGPAGVVGALALAAGAVGAGALTAEIQRSEEEAQALRDRAGEVASAWIEAGERMMTADQINSAISGIIGDEEQMKRADDLVRKLGVDLPDAIRILAGDQSALTQVEAEYQAKLKERDALEAMIEDNRGKTSQATREQRGELREFIEAYEAQAGVFESASDKFTAGTKAQSDALRAYIEQAEDATVQTDEFGNQLVTLPDGVEVVVDAKTGQATLNVDKFKGDVESIPKNPVTTVDFRVNSAATDNYLSALQRRAAQGFTVNLRPGSGRLWE